MNVSKAKPARSFTAIDLLIVLACIALLIAVFLPTNGGRLQGQKINCINNLKQIGLAFRTWSLDQSDKFPMQVSVTNGGTMELVDNGPVFVHFLVMSNELST